MKYDEGVRWLTRVRTIDLKIKEICYQIEALYSCIGLQGISYDKITVVSSPENKFERIIADIDDLKKDIEHLQLEKARVIREINKRLEKLGDTPERTVLVAFYIRGLRMEEISNDLNYELSWCYRLRQKGIKQL